MGAGAGLRRAEDPPGSTAGDQAGAPAERDARGGDPGDLRAVAGAFRDPVADVRGGRDGGARPGSVIVLGVLPGPEMSVAGVPEFDAPKLRGVVSGPALGDATGAHGRRGASEPDQSSGAQAKDVEMEEETT